MKNLNSKLKLNKRLAGYSATAVALAAISSNTDAQVAYSGLKNITVKMTNDSIDMDGDGVKDFAIMNFHSGIYNYADIKNLQSSNRWMGSNVYALSRSSYVYSSHSFYSGQGLLGDANTSSSYWGNFPGRGDKLIGVKFTIGTDIHYGWIRVNIPSTVDSIIIKDWAYQKSANYRIYTGDTIAPVLSGASVTHIGVDTANFNIATDKNTYLYYGVKKSTDPAPSVGEIIADTSFITSDNSWILAGDNTFQLSNLESDISYTVYALAIDKSFDTTTITHISFTTVDTIPPVLSAISVNNIHLTTAIAHITSDEIGTAYFAVKKSTDPAPDSAAIKAGIGFVAAGNAKVVAGTPHDFNLTGLTKATDYIVYMVAEDTSKNISFVQNAGFTTANDVGINKIKNEDVLMYPIPASDRLNITLPGNAEFAFVNILGITLLSGKLEAGNSKIDISGLVQGLYFVHLNFNGSFVVKQIIIK
jgi:Secretion system C-terminal sorting domain